MKFKDFLSLVRNSLEENFNEVDSWFLKEEPLRNYKPRSGGWSINEILEHISLTNHFLLISINDSRDKALKKNLEINIDEFEYDDDQLEKFLDIGKHGSFSWIRPEHMIPSSETSIELIRLKLEEQLQSCIATLEILKDGHGLLKKKGMSVNGLGKLDVYQYLYFLSLHAKRHIEQMEKVELEFDKKVS